MKRHAMKKLTAVPGGSGTPPEPDWSLSYSDPGDAAVAQEQWGNVIRELAGAQTLSVENGAMIERLTHFRVAFARAARDVAERGTILRAKRTDVPQVNLSWPIMRQAADAIRTIEIELGLPPIRRGKALKVQQHEKKTPRAADSYLRPVAKA